MKYILTILFLPAPRLLSYGRPRTLLLCVNTKHQFAFISSLFQIKFIEAMIILSVTYLINLSRFDLSFFFYSPLLKIF